MRLWLVIAPWVLAVVLSGAAVAGDVTVTPADTGKPTVLYRNSYALVIGIDNYSGGWPRLHEAGNDAAAVAAELTRQGFGVTLRTDKDAKLDKRTLERLIDDFVYGPGTQDDARLLIWFAGHGHTIDGEGYIVPQDSPNPTTGPPDQRH